MTDPEPFTPAPAGWVAVLWIIAGVVVIVLGALVLVVVIR